jgi:hypothetical protein
MFRAFQLFENMPANGLAFAVRVSRKDQFIRTLQRGNDVF